MSPKRITSVKISKHRRLHIPNRSWTLRHRNFIKKLSKVAATSPSKIPSLLKKAKAGELKALSEIAQNFLQKNHPGNSRKILKKLIPYKNIIRKLANKKTSIGSKRSILLKQKGGLPFLVPLLAPIVTSLISAGIQAAI